MGSVAIHVEQIDECIGCPYMDVNIKEFYNGDGLAYIGMQRSKYEVCVE